jgi:hypothetical protein
MAVTRLSDKIAAQMGAVLRSRASVEDEVLYDVHLLRVEGEDGEGFVPMIGFYAALDCPETDALSSSYVTLSAGRVIACGDDFITETVDAIWEAIVCFRMENAAKNLGDTGIKG